MKLRSWVLGGMGLAAAVAVALAQPVNVVPQTGMITSVLPKTTYSAVALALPPASTATDIACIAGSASKTISIQRISISGTAGTLVTAPFTLVRRLTADNGGTAGTTTANWGTTIAKMDTTAPTAAATLVSYSANPTINDSTPVYIRSQSLTVPTTTAVASAFPIVWEFGGAGVGQDQRLVLRGVQQQACINLNSTIVSSGLLHLSIEWTEE